MLHLRQIIQKVIGNARLAENIRIHSVCFDVSNAGTSYAQMHQCAQNIPVRQLFGKFRMRRRNAQTGDRKRISVRQRIVRTCIRKSIRDKSYHLTLCKFISSGKPISGFYISQNLVKNIYFIYI